MFKDVTTLLPKGVFLMTDAAGICFLHTGKKLMKFLSILAPHEINGRVTQHSREQRKVPFIQQMLRGGGKVRQHSLHELRCQVSRKRPTCTHLADGNCVIHGPKTTMSPDMVVLVATVKAVVVVFSHLLLGYGNTSV
ncbi:hypothetical protein CCR75_008978 [Bremia lactucae]|uniref:Uncharacterized protein n=1 Tax=Bremia lactucae TaxID=4779 RepID=A0A976IID7_BRELC|nr:hypothetical protein CCR75_008979 [Bremia lactucae]TDH72363.1 hypothetical protein CCR75_008978 [Bremia lactucae]